MSYQIPGLQITLVCDVEIKERYVAVTLAGDDRIKPATVGDVVVGVLQVPCKEDEGGPVMINGVSFMVASGAIAAGALVDPAANGTIVTGSGSIGLALNSATAADDIISVLLRTN